MGKRPADYHILLLCARLRLGRLSRLLVPQRRAKRLLLRHSRTDTLLAAPHAVLERARLYGWTCQSDNTLPMPMRAFRLVCTAVSACSPLFRGKQDALLPRLVLAGAASIVFELVNELLF